MAASPVSSGAAGIMLLPTALEGEATLRPSFVRGEDERPRVPHDHFSDEIPVVSLAGVDDVDGARRAEIRARVAAACEDWGLFQVVDHGVDAALLADMVHLSREFFALPPEEKLRFDMTGGKKGGFIVSSHLQGEAVQNWREIVHYHSYPAAARDYSRWPDTPAAWRSVVERYSERVMALARTLLGVLSEALGLPAAALEDACVEMDQKVLANYYPPCPQPELTLGIKRHTDAGTLTLLLQDLVGGLQATRDGGRTWVSVKPLAGAFVVNVGDHGHLLSNGRFKSAVHQAVVNSERGRLSVAAFQNPAPGATVYPLAVPPGEAPVLDKPITFAEMYRRKMLGFVELPRRKKQGQANDGDHLISISELPDDKPLGEILA